ncbi:MAG: ribonuclease HIII [Candidatus Gastranaerophilaceae bacterium]|jgi:ribonuclease HIII
MSLKNNSYSGKYDIKKEADFKKKLQDDGFSFKELDYAFWRAIDHNVSVSFYKSGKILVQGDGTESFIAKYLDETPRQPELAEQSENYEGGCCPQRSGSQDRTIPAQGRNDNRGISSIEHAFSSWIGTDESGKGDYFGPLVIAGVLIDETNRKILENLGVKDSKTIKDTTIIKMAGEIKKNSIFSIVTINPQKYNQLYDKFKNLNKLLAWGHARVIENILENKSCENAISDKFGDESLIQNALMKNGRKINLIQRTKAERDIAVAAASILAREEFVKRMKNFEFEYKMPFPKGASERTIEAAGNFVKKYGKTNLENIAKLHFKTTKQI